MRTIYLFFSLLLSLTAFGQPSPINRRAMAITGLVTTPVTPPFTNPMSIAGLIEWWVHTDITSSNMPVTNWIGRIHSTVLTNGNSTLRPTNTTQGVAFGLDHNNMQLTNIPLVLGSNWSVAIFSMPTRVGFAPLSTYPFFTSNTNSLAFGWGDGAGSPAMTVLANDVTGNNIQSASIPNVVSNNWDIILVNSNGPGTTVATSYLFTNGFFMSTLATHFTNDWFPAAIGWNKVLAAANHFEGFDREYFFYTGHITSVDASNLHWYRTNTYGP